MSRSIPTSQLKFAPNCSELELTKIAAELASQCLPGDVLLLEGPMGAGKSTFARSFLSALGISRGGSGSPTFAIAHEYQSASGALVLHADFYRLRSEEELEETGINSALWERRALALLEWTSLFPEYQTQLIKTSAGRVFRVSLDFCEDEQLRNVRIEDALAD